MTYKRVIKGITHWHEHEIHDRITPILGFDTWTIGTAQIRNESHDPNYVMNLTLMFPSKIDFEHCKMVISEVCQLEPS